MRIDPWIHYLGWISRATLQLDELIAIGYILFYSGVEMFVFTPGIILHCVVRSGPGPEPSHLKI